MQVLLPSFFIIVADILFYTFFCLFDFFTLFSLLFYLIVQFWVGEKAVGLVVGNEEKEMCIAKCVCQARGGRKMKKY